MPIAALPATKFMSYNGYTFNATSRVRVVARAVPDRANRVTAFVTYQIEVATVIYSDSAGGYNTDSQLDDILVFLTARSGRLRFELLGIGTFDINAPGGRVKDINYGPIPRILEVAPLGGSNAMLVRWFVETSIPECDDAAYEGRPVSFNYEYEIRQDPRGYSTRVVSGELVIPANRIANTTAISDAADRFWETVLAGVPILPGFTREHTRRLDDSKRVLTFTITDTEKMPQAFAVDCTDWDGTEEMYTGLLGDPANMQPAGLESGLVTLQATYNIARGRPKSLAFRLFSELFVNRVTAGRPFGQPGLSAIVLNYSIRNHLPSQEVTCSLTYFVKARSAETMIAASGIMTPLPPGLYGWAQWAASMQNTVLHPRGNAKLFYDRSSDAIVSLCEGEDLECSFRSQDPGNPAEIILRGFRPSLPPPAQSYLRADLSLQLTGVASMATLAPLPETALRTADLQPGRGFAELRAGGAGGGGNQGRLDNISSTSPAGFVWGGTKFPEDIMQVRAAPEKYAVLRCQIWRAGYPVPPISLLAIAGVPAILVRPSIIEKHVNHGGVPIHVADVENVYRLPDIPRRSFPIPPTY